MTRIGLLSDTHSYLDEKVFKYFEECDEIWHAGDIGTIKLADQLEAFKPLRAISMVQLCANATRFTNVLIVRVLMYG